VGAPVGTSITERASFAKSVAPYIQALEQMAAAVRMREAAAATGGATSRGVDDEIRRLAGVIEDAQIRAEAVGRAETLRAAQRLARQPGAADGAPVGEPGGALGDPAEWKPIPKVPFTEAVGDVMARHPVLAQTWDAVQDAYNTEHAFALARSTELRVTERVQKAIATSLARGRTGAEAIRSIRGVAAQAGQDMKDWTRAYAETVWRTNVTTAYAAGTFAQMADPAVRRAIAALRFTAMMDVDTRENHRAADGLIAAPEDAVWDSISPPLGYNCRCGVDPVSWPEARRANLIVAEGTIRPARIPAGAHADPGFRHTGRPDRQLYLGG
jgi:SPP1 gp7 family putative phage head morphogenesis protein